MLPNRFLLTIRINGATVSRTPMPDPIHTTTLRMGFLDRVRFLFSRGLVWTSVDADLIGGRAIMRALDEVEEQPVQPWNLPE